jgi:hypothetical protein
MLYFFADGLVPFPPWLRTIVSLTIPDTTDSKKPIRSVSLVSKNQNSPFGKETLPLLLRRSGGYSALRLEREDGDRFGVRRSRGIREPGASDPELSGLKTIFTADWPGRDTDFGQ